MNKKSSDTLHDIFQKTFNSKDKFSKIYTNWDFKSLERFIYSFEKLSEKENIATSKRYGNIVKNMAENILNEDLGDINLETGNRYSKQEIIDYVNKRPELKLKFKKLYEEIFKRNFWKLQMPLISSNYDLLMDRCNNDYERFNIIYKLYVKKQNVKAKNFNTKKKSNLNLDILESFYEKNELEKVFYLLVNKIKRKKNGKSFLKNLDLNLLNPFKKSKS